MGEACLRESNRREAIGTTNNAFICAAQINTQTTRGMKMGKNTIDLTDLVSYVDAYSATGVYPSKIYKWVEEGRLQEYRVNNLGEVKVSLSDVKKLKGTSVANLEVSLQNAHKRIVQLMEDVRKLQKANTRIKELEESIAERDASPEGPSLAEFLQYAHERHSDVWEASCWSDEYKDNVELERLKWAILVAEDYAQGGGR